MAKALEVPVKLPPKSPVQVHASSATLPETGASDMWQIPVAVMVAVAHSEAQLQRVLQQDGEEAPASESPLQAIPQPAALASEHVTEESQDHEVTSSAESVQAMAGQRADPQHGTGFCSEASNEPCAAPCTAANAEASRQEAIGAERDPSSRKNKSCSTAPMNMPCSEDAHASDLAQDEQGTSEGLCKVRSSRHSLST